MFETRTATTPDFGRVCANCSHSHNTQRMGTHKLKRLLLITNNKMQGWAKRKYLVTPATLSVTLLL